MSSISSPVLQLNESIAHMPFEIHTMEWIDQNRHERNAEPHRHNYFVIIWIKKAAGYQMIDLQRYELQDNTVYCITPGQVHLLHQEGPADGVVLSFTAEFMGLGAENADLLFNTGLFDTFSQSASITLSEETAAEMEDVVQKMRKEFSNFFLLRAEILRGFLKIFLIYLTRQYEKPPEPEVHTAGIDLVKRFFSLIEKNYTSRHMVAAYASELVVTPNYLNEVVKKLTGFAASHHIQQRIVLEAKRQAAYSNASMKEIAYQLGFDDIPHFSKFFKNAAGMSFTDFKKGFK